MCWFEKGEKGEKGKGEREVKRREGWRRGKTGNNTHTHTCTRTRHLTLFSFCTEAVLLITISSHPIPPVFPSSPVHPYLPSPSLFTYTLLLLVSPSLTLPYSPTLLSPPPTHTPSLSLYPLCLYPSIPLSLHPSIPLSLFFLFFFLLSSFPRSPPYASTVLNQPRLSGSFVVSGCRVGGFGFGFGFDFVLVGWLVGWLGEGWLGRLSVVG